MRTYGEVRHGLSGGRPHWLVTAEPHVTMWLKRVLVRAQQDRAGVVMVADTPEVCADLAWVLERWPMRLTDDVAERLHGRAGSHRASQDAVRRILDGHSAPMDLKEPAIPPRAYQLTAADIVLTTGRLLLADDVGLGKSLEGLLVLREPTALPALVVTLTHLPRQWLGELEKFLPWLHGHIVTSGRPYDPSKRRSAKGRTPDVLIMNYAKLAGWADELAGAVKTVIFDEAQELRHADTKKYNAACRVAEGADYRVQLTATPVYGYGGEIHNVVRVIAPDVLGTHDEFVREWCGGGGLWASNDRKVKVKDPAALGTYLRDQGVMLRRTRAEVGRELDPVTVIPHVVASDAAVLDAMASEAETMAERILTRTGDHRELFRMAGDFDWRLRQATGVAKAPHVAEFVRMLVETGEQVVLYGWHRDVYSVWLDKLKDCRPALYTGSESPSQKEAAKQRFLAGDARVLIMSLRSGAGLDGLQDVAHVVVFGELDWSPEVHNQAIGRLRRDGQTEPVIVYYLLADEGSDPTVAEVLQLKRMQAEPIRDPSTPVTSMAVDVDRVRVLAAEFLRRRGVALPVADEGGAA
jgi:superfamily II DNA or RNA helicase